MDQLPDEVTFKILELLDFKSLSKLSQVSQKFKVLSNSDKFWKPLCRKIWLIDETERSNIDPSGEFQTWKDVFVNHYYDFGRYVHCYAQIKLIWDRIKEFTRIHTPLIYESFLPPVKEDDFYFYENEVGYELPDDLRCLYRLCGGQRFDSPGLFGSYDEQDEGDLFAPFIEYPGNDLNSKRVPEVSANLSRYFSQKSNLKSGFFVFAMRQVFPGSIHFQDKHLFLAVYLNPISDCDKSGGQKTAKNSNLDQNSNVKNGEIEFGSVVSWTLKKDFDKKRVPIFVYETSFLDFLQNFSEKLNEYPIHNNRILKFELRSVGSTGPFTVETRTSFIREHSHVITIHTPPAFSGEMDQHFSYRYYIIMKMDPEGRPSDSCQLETRHWVITDQEGNVECVNGPGVVGEFPVMRPGASHYWISGTSYKTVVGTMGGHFTMRNLATGLPVRINCPDYVMKAPKIVFLSS